MGCTGACMGAWSGGDALPGPSCTGCTVGWLASCIRRLGARERHQLLTCFLLLLFLRRITMPTFCSFTPLSKAALLGTSKSVSSSIGTAVGIPLLRCFRLLPEGGCARRMSPFTASGTTGGAYPPSFLAFFLPGKMPDAPGAGVESLASLRARRLLLLRGLGSVGLTFTFISSS